MSPILVTGNVLPFATVTLIPAGAPRRLERSLGSPTTWILAPESNRSFGHSGGGREELLPSSPPGAAAGCADPDAEEAYMSMFAGVPLPPTTAGFSDCEEMTCERARAPGGVRALSCGQAGTAAPPSLSLYSIARVRHRGGNIIKPRVGRGPGVGRRPARMGEGARSWLVGCSAGLQEAERRVGLRRLIGR